MNLYQIKAELEQAINSIFEDVDENGEVKQEAVNRLNDLQEERNDKIDGIGAYIKNLTAEVKMLKEEEQVLKSRREAKEKKVEHLKSYLSDVLGGEKFESSRVAISFRKSDSVIVPDIEVLDSEYIKTKTEIVADKTAIKEAIKSGKEITGAYLEIKNNIQIK